MLDLLLRRAAASVAIVAGLWTVQAGTPQPSRPLPAPRLQTEFDAAPETGQAQSDESGAPSPADVLETTLRLVKGDTLAGLLKTAGVATRDVASAVTALADRLDLSRLRVGQAVALRLGRPAEANEPPTLLGLRLRPEAGRALVLERDDEGRFEVEEKVFATERRLRRAAGTISGSLIASALAAGVPQPALAELLRAFSYDVDFQRDIQPGDRFEVLLEQSWTEDGRPVDGGRVLWAELTTDGGRDASEIYRFSPRDGDDGFYDEDGQSVVRTLLRTPLELSRVSSGFGMRHHPLLGFTRLHAGVDFAAPGGTPILAAGDGQVVEAGPNGGYGRWIRIAHGDGLATGYAHLSRIAPGIRRSVRVRQGQIIGFVGSSGLSTGPHLHFELHRDGRPVNPLDVARSTSRQRLTGAALAHFRRRVDEIDRTRAAAPLD